MFATTLVFSGTLSFSFHCIASHRISGSEFVAVFMIFYTFDVFGECRNCVFPTFSCLFHEDEGNDTENTNS